jgi:hypothetical protein
VADKTKLNEEQQKDFDTLLSNNVKPEDAYKIVTGEFEGTSADLFPKLDTSSEQSTDASILAADGLNIDLIKPASERANKSINQVQIDEVGIEQDAGYISGKDLFEANGIAAGKDTELAASIRYFARFGLNNSQAQERNFKKLIIDNLKQNYDIETINKFADGIEVKYQTLKFGGKEDQGLIYRIPKELGGTGFFAAVDSPQIGLRDFADAGADTMPIVASIVGGTLGSYGGPAGTVAGSATSGALAEYARLMYGYHKLGLQNDMYTAEEFEQVAKDSAIRYFALDAVATTAFLGAAKLVLPTILGKNSLSSNTLKEFVDAKGKTNNEVLKKVTNVKNKFQKNFNLTEQEANDYFAVSLGKALIESPALQKKSRIAKGLIADEVESIKTKATFRTVEDKIIKGTTGLRNVDNTTADLIIDAAESEVKSVSRAALNKAELEAVSKTDDVLKLEKDTIGDAATDLLDRFGITIDDSYRALQGRLTEVDNVIDDYVTAYKGPIDLEGMTPVIKLIQKDKKFFEFDVFPKGELRRVPGKTAKTYKDVINKNKLIALRKVFDRTGLAETSKDFKTLIEGFTTLQKQGKLTLKDIYAMKNAINLLRETSTGRAQGIYTQIQGQMNEIIQNNLIKGPDNVAQAFKDQIKLIGQKQNNIFKNWGNDFGAGANRTNFSEMVSGKKLAAESESLFKKFVDDSSVARQNAMELGELITSKFFPESTTLTVKNSLYRNYFNNVFPKEGVQKMSHDEFVKKFGKNYESILGKQEYNTFFKKANKVVKGYENAQSFRLDQNTAIAKALPGLSVDVINNSAPGQIVKHIIESSNKKNITALMAALPDTTKANIRTLFLNEMMDSATGTGKAGGYIYKSTESINGERLLEFMRKNRGSIKQLYNDNFYNTFLEMGNVLRMLQEPLERGSITGGKGITDVANQAGLFVDIFAGPLNHKRLILNRVARIMDLFKINSDNLFLFTDYGKFIEAAKRNFLGGNYPRFLDNMGIKQRATVIDKVLKKIKVDNSEGIGKALSKYATADNLIDYANFGFNRGMGARKMFTGNPIRNPMVYKEYAKDKYEEVRGMDDMENNADVFYPIDISGKFAIEALQSVFSKIGKGGKIVREAVSGAKEEKERDFEKEEFEKKYGN